MTDLPSTIYPIVAKKPGAGPVPEAAAQAPVRRVPLCPKCRQPLPEVALPVSEGLIALLARQAKYLEAHDSAKGKEEKFRSPLYHSHRKVLASTPWGPLTVHFVSDTTVYASSLGHAEGLVLADETVLDVGVLLTYRSDGDWVIADEPEDVTLVIRGHDQPEGSQYPFRKEVVENFPMLLAPVVEEHEDLLREAQLERLRAERSILRQEIQRVRAGLAEVEAELRQVEGAMTVAAETEGAPGQAGPGLVAAGDEASGPGKTAKQTGTSP